MNRDFSVSADIARYKLELDSGDIISLDQFGNANGTFRVVDSAANTCFSVNTHLLVDVAFGMTLVRYRERLTPAGFGGSSGSARNYGVLVRLPVVEAIETVSGHRVLLPDGIRPVLTPTAGLSWNNRGPDAVFTAGSASLPKNKKFGYTVLIGAEWDNRGGRLALFHLLRTTENETPEYGFALNGDISKKGYEFALFETLTLQTGTLADRLGQVNVETSGMTLKSDGLTKLLWRLTNPGRKGVLYFVTHHVSFAWQTSSYKDSILNGTDFKQIMLSF